MSTCLVSSFRPPLLARSHSCDAFSVIKYACCTVGRRTVSRRAALSTSVAVNSAAKPEDVRHHTLTVLHKTTSLLPRILPSDIHGKSRSVSLEFWNESLDNAYEDLTKSASSRGEDKIRIVVYACDDLAGAEDLVTALLEDPFASESQNERIRSRWKSLQNGRRAISIQYGTSVSDSGSILNISSSWLQQFPGPIQLIELSSSRSAAFSINDSTKDLFTADIPVIVCNPASTPLPSVLPYTTDSPPLPLTNPHALLIISSASTSYAPEIAARVKTLAAHDLSTVFVDPSRALKGLQTLRSNVASVTRAVADAFLSADAAKNSPSDVVAALHTQTAQSLIIGSLAACRSVLIQAEREADVVRSGTSALRSQVEEAKAKVDREVFGSVVDGGDEIRKAVEHAQKDVKVVMDALTWWKLLWRVDEVREIVGSAVDKAWCRDLERKLVFHAGRLAGLQQTFCDSSRALLSSFTPPSPFHSPVLHNTLARISASPSYPLSTTALTVPLHARQHQLEFPTSRLHAAAQRVVLSMGGSMFGGLGVAWAGWAGQLGAFQFGMGLETAVGAGMLGAAVGIRWAVGSWEKAKKAWWRDWDRVGEGLERDLRATLTRTIDEHVVVVPETVCSGLESLAAQRKEEVEELQEEVAALEQECNSKE
ncbi:hypothetical protein A0H81_09080 [Grifola frondosa]|uniref:Mmc1 C-terminal domain-containing protein n=1 Tax=Grifola frondosa TaxID=5627 RepID=A0A1C7M1Q7_GRIFR|nr:hypothetical protein A0H81_09080 [Grifola frondosa]